MYNKYKKLYNGVFSASLFEVTIIFDGHSIYVYAMFYLPILLSKSLILFSFASI